MLGHVLIKFLIIDLKKYIKSMLMRFTYLYWKVSQSKQHRHLECTRRKSPILDLKKFLLSSSSFVVVVVFKSSPEGRYYSIFPSEMGSFSNERYPGDSGSDQVRQDF